MSMISTAKRNLGAFPTLYPTPLVLCGTYDEEGRPNIAPLAWVGICCSTPAALQVSVRKDRYTHGAILARGAFTVNLPSEEQAAIADFCGLTSGRRVDKFAATGLTPKRGEFVDAPVAEECPVCVECRLLHTLTVGSHDLFVGEIMASWVNESCIERDGSVNPTKISPIVYAPRDGNYYMLGGSVGRAFDIGRALMPEKEENEETK